MRPTAGEAGGVIGAAGADFTTPLRCRAPSPERGLSFYGAPSKMKKQHVRQVSVAVAAAIVDKGDCPTRLGGAPVPPMQIDPQLRYLTQVQ